MWRGSLFYLNVSDNQLVPLVTVSYLVSWSHFLTEFNHLQFHSDTVASVISFLELQRIPACIPLPALASCSLHSYLQVFSPLEDQSPAQSLPQDSFLTGFFSFIFLVTCLFIILWQYLYNSALSLLFPYKFLETSTNHSRISNLAYWMNTVESRITFLCNMISHMLSLGSA